MLKDHLGTTDVLLTGTWNGGTFANPVPEYQAFDPWGERRKAETWENFRIADTDAFHRSAQDHDRGYTGHEQLDDSGLIHMNGRIYDPELGRFLSPDPFVQIPEYSQNFNRYSYVLNNPLNATDPSGYFLLSKVFGAKMDWLKENWRVVVVIVVVAVLTYFTAGTASAWGAGLYASATGTVGAAAGSAAAGAAAAFGGAVAGGYIGAVAGGLSAALNGGDLGDVLRGALIGGAQGAITGGILHGMGEAAAASGQFADKAAHVVGHGIVGGAANVAMGGKFSDGFISAAAGAGAGYMGLFNGLAGSGFGNVAARTAIAGVVGGTVSVLGGGKFANGAYTAAFQHLLNAELGRAIVRQQARTIRANIQKLYDRGIRDFEIGNDKIDILARNALYYALDNRSSYENLSYKDFMKHLSGATGDSVFVDRWVDAKFNVIARGGMAPVGRFQSSDINYFYFTFKTTIYSKGQNTGALAGHAANLGWNVGEFLLGNDLQGKTWSPPNQTIDQIPRTAPWIEYGSNIFGKYQSDK